MTLPQKRTGPERADPEGIWSMCTMGADPVVAGADDAGMLALGVFAG
jgi:hypothetical protein